MTDAERQAILDRAIEDPQSATVDGTTINEHNIKDLADVVNRERANEAASKPHRGVRFNRLVPPGT